MVVILFPAAGIVTFHAMTTMNVPLILVILLADVPTLLLNALTLTPVNAQIATLMSDVFTLTLSVTITVTVQLILVILKLKKELTHVYSLKSLVMIMINVLKISVIPMLEVVNLLKFLALPKMNAMKLLALLMKVASKPI
jgi:hypothetical protein